MSGVVRESPHRVRISHHLALQGTTVKVVVTATCAQEAEFVARTAQGLHGKSSASATPHPTVAVLFRTSSMSRTIEEALTKRKIPYDVVGGCVWHGLESRC